AERAVLGAILMEPTALPRAIELLAADEFYKDVHRKIYGAMVRLFERSEPADVLTVTEELKRAGELEEVGGPAALATCMEEAIVATQFAAYAAIVREKAALRDMIRTAHDLMQEELERRRPGLAAGQRRRGLPTCGASRFPRGPTCPTGGRRRRRGRAGPRGRGGCRGRARPPRDRPARGARRRRWRSKGREDLADRERLALRDRR